MGLSAAVAGGMAGACALTVAHETLRHTVDGAPRMDLVGSRGLRKVLAAAGLNAPRGQALFEAALAGDLLGNAATYALIGCGKKAPLRGTILGIALGVGAVILPEALGIARPQEKQTPKTELMTIGVYALGGLVAGFVARMAHKKLA